ncbi:MAG TPA: metallophosphoesterase, partial [Verrucomicrobiae bacterium]
KLSVPEDSEIFFRADLHGDVRSLLADLTWLNEKGYLRGFSAARTNFYMIFLGDYTDRGAYGIEVLYTLLRLKLANPDRVFLARGNHEEVGLQLRYGFIEEGQRKYGATFNARKLERAYDFLPVVIYAGSRENFIQCNHGGMEPGFSPRALLETSTALSFQFLGALQQKKFLTDHPEWLAGLEAKARQTVSGLLLDFRPESPVLPTTLGFMWNDFAVFASEPALVDDPDRAFIYGAASTQFLLRSAGTSNLHVHAVFRGHQQSSILNPMMRRLVASRGVFRHWQAADSAALLDAPVGQLSKILEQNEMRGIPSGSVWTFNVAPDSVYGERCGFSFDTFGILKLSQNFADWRLRVVNVPIDQ